jgi:hypothetical protein
MYLMKMRLLVVALALVGTAFGADINGKWKGTLSAGDMAVEQNFTFKVDGGKITGTMSDQFIGEVKITEGAVKGDDIAFTASGKTEMGDMTFKFSGKVTGPDEMKLSMAVAGGGGGGPEGGGGMGAMEIVVKRVK